MKLVGLGIGFVVIVGMVIRKKPLGLAMLAGTLITGLGTGLGLAWLAGTWFGTLIARDTLELAAMVGCITLLSHIMSASGLHDRLVAATVKLLRSAKLAVMVIPPLIGAMPIPGGAIVSAPLIDQPADSLGLSQGRKAAINLIFRHANFFVLPFSSSLVLAAKLIGVDIYHLIAKLWPLAVATWIVGYFTLVRDARPVAMETPSAAAGAPGEAAASLDRAPGPGAGREFVVSASPILLSLVVGFALKVPFWMAVACGIVLAVGLTWRTHPWTLARLARGVDAKLVLAMFGIMGFRGVVVAGRSLSQLSVLFESSAIPLPVLGFGLALLVSIVSANHNTTLGIVYPMILPMVGADQVMAYAVLMFAGSYVAYMASPLHLCQIMTNEHCKISLPAAFREYYPSLVGVAVAAWGLFHIYR
jgi:integral membrane protein (TIGR00529 family)